MRRHIAAWCIAALGLATLTACASTGTGVAAGPDSTAPTPVASSPAVTPSPLPTKVPPPPITMSPPHTIAPTAFPSPRMQTLVGQVYTGAEPSCLLLKQDNVPYLLLTPDTMKLRAGTRVSVTGYVLTGIMTHCQQGRPFKVVKLGQPTP